MSHSVNTPPRTWPWVVLVVVAVVVIVGGISVFAAMTSGSPTPAAAPSSVTPTVTSTPVVTPTPKSTPKKNVLTAAGIAAIEGAIESSTPTDIYDYLANPVHIQFAASDFNSDRTPDLAMSDLDYTRGSSGWNWKLDAATLASFRAGSYASSFPDGAIIGQSAQGYVIAFTVTKAKVTAIFISKTAALVTDPAPAPATTP